MSSGLNKCEMAGECGQWNAPTQQVDCAAARMKAGTLLCLRWAKATGDDFLSSFLISAIWLFFLLLLDQMRTTEADLVSGGCCARIRTMLATQARRELREGYETFMWPWVPLAAVEVYLPNLAFGFTIFGGQGLVWYPVSCNSTVMWGVSMEASNNSYTG